MAGSRRRPKRQRGSIERLPSGALRVAVYTGFDPVTGKRHYVREIVPARAGCGRPGSLPGTAVDPKGGVKVGAKGVTSGRGELVSPSNTVNVAMGALCH